MSATLTWSIEQLTAYPQYDGQVNVVTKAKWKCVGQEIANGKTFVSEDGAENILSLGNLPDFTPYSQLTEQQVLSWVWSDGVDKNKVEAAVQQSLNRQINPEFINPPLPWSN